MNDMDKDIIRMIVVVVGIAIILAFCLLYVATNIELGLFGGKDIYCVEDSGAEFEATISNEFWDSFWYFSASSTGLRFKGTDGKIYGCRGMYEVGD